MFYTDNERITVMFAVWLYALCRLVVFVVAWVERVWQQTVVK
jgi:hypothetical protein